MTKLTRTPTPAELRAHAHELAAAFKVRLVEQRGMQPEDACALVREGVALVHPVIDETTYAVALHELGHLIAPTGALRHRIEGNPESIKRTEEDAAWAWARHYALIWTPVMDAIAKWAEATYHEPEAPAPTPPPSIDWSQWE